MMPLDESPVSSINRAIVDKRMYIANLHRKNSNIKYKITRSPKILAVMRIKEFISCGLGNKRRDFYYKQ